MSAYLENEREFSTNISDYLVIMLNYMLTERKRGRRMSGARGGRREEKKEKGEEGEREKGARMWLLCGWACVYGA